MYLDLHLHDLGLFIYYSAKRNIFFSEFVAILMCEEGTFGKVTGENFAEDITKQPLDLMDVT